jgi:murein DD-endopeptidase MepM/ murein hydrolase activator NlpD
MGLAGYPAHDFFAPSGSEVVAPIGGKVIRLSGHDPKQGPTEGPHGPLGWSVYIKGNDGKTYFLTHMGSRSVKVGEKVKAGVPIGTVADYAAYGTPSHIHMGVSG